MTDDLPALFLVEGGDNKRLKPFASPKAFAEDNLERDIEAWVKNSMLNDVPVVGELALFAQQPGYKALQGGRRPDLLALDGDRNIVVIEFKRDRAPDDIVFQTLNYAAAVEGASEEEEETEPALPTDQEFLTGFNAKPRIILVAA